MNKLILISFLFIHFGGFSQDFKNIKKSIPEKGIKTIELLPMGGERYFLFTSKDSKSIWDHQLKQVILRDITFSGTASQNPKWFRYIKNGSFGIYDISENKIVMESSSTINIHTSQIDSLLLLISRNLICLADLTSGKFLTVDFESTSNDSEVDLKRDNAFINYSNKARTLTFSSEKEFYGDPTFIYYEVSKIGNNIKALYEEGGQTSSIYNKLGSFIREVPGNVNLWDKGFLVQTYSSISYYNYAMKTIYEQVGIGNHQLHHFQELFDGRIKSIKPVQRGIYQVSIEDKTGFYDITKRKFESELYDDLIEIGTDIYWGGLSYFTEKDKKYGIYNSKHGELLQSKYSKIQQRLFNDGSIGYRANGELRIFKLEKQKLQKSPLQKWNNSLDAKSILINHLNIIDNKLILSLRKTEADTHDFSYGTMTLYHTGSGVFDLDKQSWIIEPDYHTFTPFQNYYVALQPGNSNRTWTETVFFDEEFWPITAQQLGVSFIYQGTLITRDENWQLVALDIYNNYVLKNFGKINHIHEDFRLKDGYLFLGHNQFRRDKSLSGFDISKIITPKLELRQSLKYVFWEYIADGIVVIAQIPDNHKHESVADFYKNSFRPDKKALFHIDSNKVISEWWDDIIIENEMIQFNKNGEITEKDFKDLNIH